MIAGCGGILFTFSGVKTDILGATGGISLSAQDYGGEEEEDY